MLFISGVPVSPTRPFITSRRAQSQATSLAPVGRSRVSPTERVPLGTHSFGPQRAVLQGPPTLRRPRPRRA